MKSAALLSSERQDWRTPGWFLDLVRAVGSIALDPATGPDNPTGARFFFSPEGPPRGRRVGPCGLRGDWTRGPGSLAFVNPPYGAHLSGPVDPDRPVTKKCQCGRVTQGRDTYGCPACAGTGRIVTGIGTGWAARIAQDPGPWIALIPSRTDASWWHALHAAADWGVFWRSPSRGSRIQFVDPSTGKARQGSTLASTVFYRGPDPGRFLGVFAAHGRPFPGGGLTTRLVAAVQGT